MQRTQALLTISGDFHSTSEGLLALTKLLLLYTHFWQIMVMMILFLFQADEVENKADDMAKAIALQNKKVEEQSEAMERAINDKGKLVDAKEEEDKFEKASEKVDAVGDAADKKFEQKGKPQSFIKAMYPLRVSQGTKVRNYEKSSDFI